jgi:hypothetical protein
MRFEMSRGDVQMAEKSQLLAFMGKYHQSNVHIPYLYP